MSLSGQGPGDRITHARLQADGATIIASNGLADGGTIKMPLSRQTWGAEVGWLTDKFGINWMISIDKA
jgi:uncharacterized glyoxalase superfamily protein PhnB